MRQDQQQQHEPLFPSSHHHHYYNCRTNNNGGGVMSQSLGAYYPGRGLIHRHLSDVSTISYAGYLQKRSNRPHYQYNQGNNSNLKSNYCWTPFPSCPAKGTDSYDDGTGTGHLSYTSRLKPKPAAMEEYSGCSSSTPDAAPHLPQHHQAQTDVVENNNTNDSNQTHHPNHRNSDEEEVDDDYEESMAFAASFFGVDLRSLHPDNQYNQDLHLDIEEEEEEKERLQLAATTATRMMPIKQQTPQQRSPIIVTPHTPQQSPPPAAAASTCSCLDDNNRQEKRGSFHQTRRSSFPISMQSNSNSPTTYGNQSNACNNSSSIINNHLDNGNNIVGGHPSDVVDEDGHIWRSKYCVLEGGILYWYRYQSDAEAPEAHLERQQHALHYTEEQSVQAEATSPANFCSNGGGGGFSHFTQSPITRKPVRDGAPHSWEKFVPLSSVGSVRSAEVEFGPNSFELTSTMSADGDDDTSFSSGGHEKLILRARNSDEMNEWLFQFHRSIASYVMDIMECAASSSNAAATAAATAVAAASPSASSTAVMRGMDIHHPAFFSHRPLVGVSVDTINASSAASPLRTSTTCPPFSPRFLYQPAATTATTPLSHGHGRSFMHRRRLHNHPVSACGQQRKQQQEQNNVRMAFSYQEASPLMTMSHRSNNINMPLIPQHVNGSGIDAAASTSLPSQLVHRLVTPTPPPRGVGVGGGEQQQLHSLILQQHRPPRERVVEEASSSVPPELSAPQQSSDPETERPPPSATNNNNNSSGGGGSKKYVPPHLRNKNRTSNTLVGTSMPPSPKEDQNHNSSTMTSLSGGGGGPSSGVGNLGNNSSSNGFGTYGHQHHSPAASSSPLLRPRPSTPHQQDPSGYYFHHDDSINNGFASVDDSDGVMLMDEMDDAFAPYMMQDQIINVKLGGCADPDLVDGSILDDMYIPRKASRLGKGPSGPFGSNFASGKGTTGSSNSRGLCWEIGATSVIGIRESNEDAYLIVGDLLEAFKSHHGDSSSSPRTIWDHHGSLTHAPSLFAVFDGHCGDHAARFAAERLLSFLHEQSLIEQQDLEAETDLSSEDRLDRLREIMRQTVSNLDHAFCNLCVEEGRDWESGTTALIATLVNEHLVIANLGDARGVLCRSVEDESAVELLKRDGWKALHLTDCSGSSRCLFKEVTDIHSPSREDERARIEEANGWVTTEKEIPVGQFKRMALFDQDVVDILMRCFSDRYQPQPSPRASAPQRILQISRVCGELAVSRAIGDRDFKAEFNVRHSGNNVSQQSSETLGQCEWDSSLFLPYPDDHSRSFVGDLISNQPEFRSIPVGQEGVSDEFLLLACDGLWDVMDPDDAVRLTRDLLFVKCWSAKRAANRLAELAVHLGSSDNITVIVLRLYTP